MLIVQSSSLWDYEPGVRQARVEQADDNGPAPVVVLQNPKIASSGLSGTCFTSGLT